jgi:hypothetical protein
MNLAQQLNTLRKMCSKYDYNKNYINNVCYLINFQK